VKICGVAVDLQCILVVYDVITVIGKPTCGWVEVIVLSELAELK
jgi:hypothetical protein